MRQDAPYILFESYREATVSFRRVLKILCTIRKYILELPQKNSDRRKVLNKKIEALYSELDTICGKAHVPLFRYEHIGMGITMFPKEKLIIDSIEDAITMYDEYEIRADAIVMQITQNSTAKADDKEVRLDIENDLISQARKWLDTNTKQLAPTRGGFKEFFKKYWKWLIPVTISAIGAIAVPIITLLVK